MKQHQRTAAGSWPSTRAEAKKPVTTEQRKKVERHDELVYRLQNVNTFLGAKMVADIKAQLCRDYADWRTHTPNDRMDGFQPPLPRKVSDQSARRELEDLRAAINAWHAENILLAVPVVTLPAKAEGRKRWLTRSGAARLLGAALGFVWDAERGAWKRDADGRIVRRDRVTRTRRRHAARFILIGLYSAPARGDDLANALGPDDEQSVVRSGTHGLSRPRRRRGQDEEAPAAG